MLFILTQQLLLLQVTIRLYCNLFFCFFFRVPEILKTFDHPSEELLSEFLAEIDCFKKEGENYWHEKVI